MMNFCGRVEVELKTVTGGVEDAQAIVHILGLVAELG